MVRPVPSYAGSPWLLWHQIKPTDTDVGGRDPGGLRWKAHRRWLMEHVTRLHSEPAANAGVGQRAAWSLRWETGRCIPGELAGVTPHRAGLKRLVDGTSLTDFLFQVSILSKAVLLQSDVPSSPPPERDVVTLQERFTISFCPGDLKMKLRRMGCLDGNFLSYLNSGHLILNES